MDSSAPHAATTDVLGCESPPARRGAANTGVLRFVIRFKVSAEDDVSLGCTV